MWLTTLVSCVVLFGISASAQNEYDYSAYYNYEDDYAQNGTLVEEDTPNQMQDPEFRASVTCSKTLMTLEIDRTLLPTGLGFAGSISEDMEAGVRMEPITCIRITHNSTHFIYKVSMKCRRAVGRLKYSYRTIYTHELVMGDVRSERPEARDTYSIIMDCVTSSQRSRDVAQQTWTPELRVFERRDGSSCAVKTCPHGDLCLSPDDVNGYFCSCPDLKGGCDCPGDFYGCSGGQNTVVRSLICVRSDHLCNSKFDCPLQDDEKCTDTWQQWGAWSSCTSTCGEGTQTRQRSCARTLTKDPSKTKRTCRELQGAERESRSCERGSCSSVRCGSEKMTIEIPLEYGMDHKAVDARMHLSRDHKKEECRPKINSTHVTFVIPLHKCGTTTWVDSDVIFYSNVVVYEARDQASSVIVREYGHSYTAKCQYQRRQTVSMRSFDPGADTTFEEVAVLKFEDEFSRDVDRLDMMTHHSSGDGVFEYKMDLFEDSSYVARYEEDDYPLEKRLGERLYVSVNFKSQDEDLNVFIERCWATSSGQNGASDDAMYLFINRGCAVDPTVQFHNNDMSHFSDRFSIESFKFNDAQYWYIYFRCDVILCDASENDPACQRECNSAPKRRRRSADRSERTYGRVVQGPVVVLEAKDPTEPRHWRSGVSVGSVEHKIITFEEVQRERSLQGRDNGGGGVFSSPYVLAAIVGSVCLSVGLTLGLALTRRNTSTARHKDEETKESTASKTGRQGDESGTSLVKDC